MHTSGGGLHTSDGSSSWFYPPPVNKMTHACENIALPHTSYVGGKKSVVFSCACFDCVDFEIKVHL